jgi:hypothetical protein
MKPNEHKTVQGRILKYAQEIGWTFVPREEAEKRRGLVRASDQFLRQPVAEIPCGVAPEERSCNGKGRNVCSFRLVVGYNKK